MMISIILETSALQVSFYFFVKQKALIDSSIFLYSIY